VPQASFLFTDVEGSTQLLRRVGDRYWAHLKRCRAVLESAAAEHGGRVLGTEGDSMLAVFDHPSDAVAAAVEGQLALVRDDSWPEDERPRVRVGIHCGDVEQVGEEYFGLVIHQAARICAAGHGDQILVSDDVRAGLSGRPVDDVSVRPLGRHKLKDFHDATEVFQLHHPSLREEFPSLRVPSLAAHNLPASATSFIGREAEVAEVVSLLDQHRIVTITGPGGAGKTRLAVECARALTAAYPDGIWFLDLSDLGDAGTASERLAGLVGARSHVGTSVMTAISEILELRTSLLLFDNCEHLLPDIAELIADVAETCPSVDVLATSRERLRIGPEVLFEIPPLPVPESAAAPAVEALRRCAGTRLFLDRAKQAGADIEVSDEDAVAIAALCARLDGLPLAIELAAPLVRSIGVARLNERFETAWVQLRSRAGAERHRTLDDMVEWSYSSLNPSQKALYESLAVFTGGWTVEAAEFVCSSSDVLEETIFLELTELVDKSLVALTRTAGDVRYRFLESIRRHAAARLGASGSEARVARRHRDWYLAFVEELQMPSLTGDRSILDRIVQEMANIRTAVGWSIRAGDTDAALRMASALWAYFRIRGNPGEGVALLEDVLGSAESGSPQVRARALGVLGSLKFDQGKADEALPLLEQALPVARKANLGGAGGASFILSHIGDIKLLRGALEEARAVFEDGLRLSRESDEGIGIVHLLLNLADVGADQGDLPAARERAEEALAVARDIGSKNGVCLALRQLAGIAFDSGDRAAALVYLEEGVSIAHETADPASLSSLLRHLGEVKSHDGHIADAESLWVEALGHAYESGIPAQMALSMIVLLSLPRVAGDPRASRWLAIAHEVARAGGVWWQEAHRYLGRLDAGERPSAAPAVTVRDGPGASTDRRSARAAAAEMLATFDRKVAPSSSVSPSG